MSYRIINGDSAKELKKFKDNSIDAVITDPPYGIEFLAKDWDSNTGAVEIWQECLRVLKPGGHLLAFSAARTYHILATNIQSVGFEIRDQIMWLYASGFPKAQDIGKAIERRAGKKDKQKYEGRTNNGKLYYPKREEKWGDAVESAKESISPRCVKCHSSTGPIHKKCSRKDCIKPWIKEPADNEWHGWKTALKPAHEPICMARKPMKGSAVDNVLKHGVGALNIDASRIAFKDLPQGRALDKVVIGGGSHTPNKSNQPEYTPNEQGRFPSNVIGEVEGYQKYFYKPKSDHEPICMARKPMKGSTVDNVLKHNVGALNIDATRIPSNDKPQANSKGTTKGFRKFMDKHQKGEAQDNSNDEGYIPNTEGRFPSNVIGEVEGYQKYFYCPKVSRKERHRGFEHIPDPISNYTLGDVKNHPLWDKSIGTNLQRLKHKIMEHNKDVGPKLDPLSHIPTTKSMLEQMGAAYADKDGNPVAYEDRHNKPHILIPGIGLIYTHGLKHEYEQWCKKKNKDPLSHIPTDPGGIYDIDKGKYIGTKRQQANSVGNNHPTVKPVALMKYLIKLVAPQGSHIIDPFMGSGTTGMAAKELGITFTGIEMDKNYCDIAKTRIDASKADQFEKLFDDTIVNE